MTKVFLLRVAGYFGVGPQAEKSSAEVRLILGVQTRYSHEWRKTKGGKQKKFSGSLPPKCFYTDFTHKIYFGNVFSAHFPSWEIDNLNPVFGGSYFMASF